jgi:hypothetical protein
LTFFRCKILRLDTQRLVLKTRGTILFLLKSGFGLLFAFWNSSFRVTIYLHRAIHFDFSS